MRAIDLLHRWLGGLVGLLLALLGLSGTLLLHADLLFRPAQGLTGAPVAPAAIVSRILSAPGAKPDYILLGSPQFPLHRVMYTNGSGAYIGLDGAVVTQWQSMWERPEIWLFDFHRHLFAGAGGEMVVGFLGIAGFLFVVTGFLLWWQRRKTFSPRLLPPRLSRPAIVRHHRDLGVLLAPLLLLLFVTGVSMALKPVGLALVSPWSSSAEIKAANAKPVEVGKPLSLHLDWTAVLADAQRRFPDAELRLASFPKTPGDLIAIRLRRPDEWLPNGRTTLWYAPDSGAMIKLKDAYALPVGASILDKAYPLHAAKVGGLVYRLVLTLSGLGLVLLGTLAVYSFWFKRRPNG